MINIVKYFVNLSFSLIKKLNFSNDKCKENYLPPETRTLDAMVNISV